MENNKKEIRRISTISTAVMNNNLVKFKDIYEGKDISIPVDKLKYLKRFLEEGGFNSGDTYNLAYVDKEGRIQFFPISGRDISGKNLGAVSLGREGRDSITGGKVYDVYIESGSSNYLEDVLRNVYIPKPVESDAELERFNYMGHEAIISMKGEEVEVQLLNFFDRESMNKLVNTLERLELYLFSQGKKDVKLSLYNFSETEQQLYYESVDESKRTVSSARSFELEPLKDRIAAKEKVNMKEITLKRLKNLPKGIGRKLAYWILPGGAIISSVVAAYHYIKLPKKIADTTAQLEEYRNNLSQDSSSLENAIDEYNSEMGKEYDDKEDYEKELSNLENLKSDVDKEYYDIVSSDGNNDTLENLKSFENFVRANGGTVETIEYNGQEIPVSFMVNGEEIDLNDYSASDLGVSEEQYESWKVAYKEANEFKSKYSEFEDYLNGNKYEDLKSDLEEIISLFDSRSNFEVYISDKEAELSHLNLLNSIFTGIFIGLPISIAIGAFATYLSNIKKDRLLNGSRIGVLDLNRKAYLYYLIDSKKLELSETFSEPKKIDKGIYNSNVQNDVAAFNNMFNSILNEYGLTEKEFDSALKDKAILLKYKKFKDDIQPKLIAYMEERAKRALEVIGEKVGPENIPFWQLINKFEPDAVDVDKFKSKLSFMLSWLAWEGEKDYNPETLENVVVAAKSYLTVDKEKILLAYDSHKDWLNFFGVSTDEVKRGIYLDKMVVAYKDFYILKFLFDLKKELGFKSVVDVYNFYKDSQGSSDSAPTKITRMMKNYLNNLDEFNRIKAKYEDKLPQVMDLVQKLKEDNSNVVKLIKKRLEIEKRLEEYTLAKEVLDKGFIYNFIFNRTIPMTDYFFRLLVEKVGDEKYREKLQDLLVKRELNFMNKKEFSSKLDRKLTKKIARVLKKAGYSEEISKLKKEKIFK